MSLHNSTTFTDLFTEIVRTEIALWDSLDAHLTSTAGVSVAQFQALTVIGSGAGDARVQDVSDSLSITVGATSKLIDRLERDGLATRRSNPNDRRSSIIDLTGEGSAALAAATPAAEHHLSSLFRAPAPDLLGLGQILASIRLLATRGGVL